MSLRLVLLAVVHFAIAFAFFASPSRWTTAALWTWTVLTIAVSLATLVRGLPSICRFHATYISVAAVIFLATGLNYVNADYWLPAAIYDWYSPARWDIEFDGITSATENTYVEAMYRHSRNRIAITSMSIPVIAGAFGVAAAWLRRPHSHG